MQPIHLHLLFLIQMSKGKVRRIIWCENDIISEDKIIWWEDSKWRENGWFVEVFGGWMVVDIRREFMELDGSGRGEGDGDKSLHVW